jgi:hypothetical protein
MKAFQVLFVVFVLGLCANAAFSQCCCSGTELTLTDSSGNPLPIDDVKITESVRGTQSNRIRPKDAESGVAKFEFQVGCGNGTESLAIEYAGSTMRVRFKLYGDFGHPKTSIAITHGDYVAEFEKRSEDDNGRTTIAIRPASNEEMKEIEPKETGSTN